MSAIVWIVDEWAPYDSSGSIGVFSTREAAIEAVEAEGWTLDQEKPQVGQGLRFSHGDERRWYISPMLMDALISEG